MVICRSSRSLRNWSIVALFSASIATAGIGCASGTTGDTGMGSSELSGGGGVTPKTGKKPKAGMGGKLGKAGTGGKKGGGTGGKTGGGGIPGLGSGGGGKSGGKMGGGAGGKMGGGGGKMGGGKGSGSKGSGSGGKGSGMKGYAFVEPRDDDRVYEVNLRAGESQTVYFTWNLAEGIAPPADLAVATSARTLLQISSTLEGPFARAELEVVPIEEGARYHLVLSRDGNVLTAAVLDEDEDVVVQAKGFTTDDASTASIVLPGDDFRSAVDCEEEE